VLRITIHETEDTMVIQLEGRIAGPWAAELSRTWLETAPRLASRKLSLDLRNVTYTDVSGKQILQEIFAQTGASLVTSTPWTQYLAEEVTGQNQNRTEGEPKDGNNE
jgi:anti-anti-sigma regulatory factor